MLAKPLAAGKARTLGWITAGLVVAVLLLATPVGATTPASRVFTPPYFTASLINDSWGNVTSKPATLVLTTPSLANGTSGAVSLAMHGNASGGGSSLGTGLAGFGIPFTISNSGLHSIRVNWSLSWVGSQSSQCLITRAGPLCSHGQVEGTVFLQVVDLTNGTVFAPASASRVFVDPTGAHGFAGSRSFHLFMRVGLVKSHSYELQTFVRVTLTLKGAVNGTSPLLAAGKINLSGPKRGGTLASVVV
jgi:hypothetical protein